MWYPDSEATSHITSSADNIHCPRPFSDKQSILTADGSPLPIRKIEHSLVTNSLNKSFALRDLLHVPSATWNLLSIYQFCTINHVYLVFNSQNVHVRDSMTNEVLLEGRAKGGLYELPLSINSSGAVLSCV